MKTIKKILLITLVLFTGFVLGRVSDSERGTSGYNTIKRKATGAIAKTASLSDRQLVLMENPGLIGRIMEGGDFGNDNFSPKAAQNMFGIEDAAIKDVIKKTITVKVAEKVWLIKFPIVNCVLLETNEGLVLIDTGMKPAGPALLKEIRKISELPIHTIIYTHGHVDHCYGTWALMEAGENPRIIAHENIQDRFNRYLRLRGSIAKYMSQPEEQLPSDSADIVWPTRYFSGELDLSVGGANMELRHISAETDDQLYIWLPDEKILVSADYYQGFLPNAGNGKRVQRDVEQWASALRIMAGLQAEYLLPMHGDHLTGSEQISDNLLLHADALDHILTQTIDGLNAGLRKDQVFQGIELPASMKDHPLLKEEYVTAKDISKMIIKQYTGWWDDIPSHWSPETMENQAHNIVSLAGGMDNLLAHTRQLSSSSLALASHMIDYAWLAEPENPEVQALLLEIYKERIMDEKSVTQEMLVYLDHMSMVRAAMK